ncbi:hypothetical protein RAC89_00345 [Paenibacillus sp. GD4]|uniref:hypothetical protein n=1 Tax=Paenibacillus sp. GD4 TaxID=3068890 RepID=UPI00279690EF|nr:hypothetical protein [Paenibacillus sp. GD4]MDQ1908947.1 hypothetical protein [Paenibacillus sp. GD4]
MFEFIAEGVKKAGAAAETVKQSIEKLPMESMDSLDEYKEAITTEDTIESKEKLKDNTDSDLEAPNEAAPYMTDDTGLNERTKEFADTDYINRIREGNEKVDAVLSRQEEVLSGNPSELEYQRAFETLDRYKGTIFEQELKHSLMDQFETADAEQQVVQTEFGATKPDIVMRGALEDIRIGDLEIGQGEDLYIEAKCGSSDYIRNEMGHILRQVEGHGDNSLVVVTNDYLELSTDVRAQFEKQLAEKGGHIYVADISSTELQAGLLGSLKI